MKSRTKASLSKAQLDDMIGQATADAYDELEQQTGWMTMIEDNLKVPFETKILGAPATVTKIDFGRDESIVAICARDGEKQAVPILDLPLPRPLPKGAEWIEAYRHWRGER